MKCKLKNFLNELSIKNFGLLVVGIMLFIAILDLPYFYYRLLRATLCVFSFYIGISNDIAIPVRIFLIFNIILFNPFEPFSFEKETWTKIDIVLGSMYLIISLTDHFTILNLTSKKKCGYEMFDLSGNKYTRKLIDEIEAVITDFENNGTFCSDCKSEILPIAKQFIIQRKKDAINITDYNEMAMTLIINLTFDLLSSGKYHVYTNLLNDTGKSIYDLYNYCMKWAVRNNKVTQEQYDEQVSMLRKNISFVG